MARLIALLILALGSGAILLGGVFAATWWSARSEGAWIEVSTGGDRGCVPGRCFDHSLDDLERRDQRFAHGRKRPADERDRIMMDRLSWSRLLRVAAPLSASLLILGAAIGFGGRRVAGNVLGIAAVVAATITALLTLGVFKTTEHLGDMAEVRRGAGFPVAFAGAVFVAIGGALVAAPMLANRRWATPVLGALAVVGALSLGAATVSTWCWSTRTSHSSGEVTPIRSTTLLRATECHGGERCPVIWLGGTSSHDPPEAVLAGRITFAGAIVTAGLSLLLAGFLLRSRSRSTSRVAVHLVIAGNLACAALVLVSSAWFVLQVPALLPTVGFLGWGPVLAVSGAILSGATAVCARGVLTRAMLPEAVAKEGATHASRPAPPARGADSHAQEMFARGEAS